MLPGLAQIYAQAGARSTRPAAETFGWRELEPTAPREGKHDYKWDKVDRYITEYQNAGFDQIQIYTTAWNEWASAKPKNHFPDPQYLDDYEAYIFNLVTRYSRALPGLKYPVLDYVIEREWTEFFPGTTDEYLQLLTIAHRAVKRANPNARVWLVPLMMLDVFDNNPSADEIARRARVNRTFRHPISETQKLLARPELFDIIEIHALGDYTELEATTRWLRAEMQKNGYVKPIFIGDAMGLSQGIWANNLRAITANATDADFLTFAPLRANDAIRFVHLLEAMKDTHARDHDAATRWFRAEHSKSLVKKFAAAIYAGYAGMNVWALADIPALHQPRITSDWFVMGMIDAQLSLPTWKPGAPRPAYYALQQTIDKLGNVSSVEKLNTGSNVIAYRFTARGKPIIVAWNEPGRLHFPGESEPTARATLPINAPRATITRTITEMGARAPRVETLTTTQGALTLTLDATPVFIEPAN
ncbi:MAG: hypothetical protein HZC40_01840 [Chloroflexi bacterium]|nr:hypothetical protein [Chloroflexota bacterium]